MKSHSIVYYLLLLLSLIKQSHQATYSCDIGASCGCSINSTTVSKIVGGETASLGAWGWAVSIKIGAGGLCGGSIISSSWIITAAHCIIYPSVSQYTVYAGSNTRWAGSQTRFVSNITVHPQYDSSTFVNDIALLQLSSPLNMTDPKLKTVCLPSVSQAILSAGEWPPVPVDVVAVGWGTLSEGGTSSPTLQQVTVQTVAFNASTCTSSMANPNVQFCAGVPGGGKDTCQGDSGGPLMMFSPHNQWILVGLTSSGIGCARPTYSGMYTRVAALQNWINTNTNNAVSWVDLSNVTISTITYPPVTTTITTTTSTVATTTPTRIPLHASTTSASILNILITLFIISVGFRQV